MIKHVRVKEEVDGSCSTYTDAAGRGDTGRSPNIRHVSLLDSLGGCAAQQFPRVSYSLVVQLLCAKHLHRVFIYVARYPVGVYVI